MTILVLGAGGLIGCAIATDLMQRGLSVVAAARRFTRSQRTQLGHSAREFPIVPGDSAGLTELLRTNEIDVVVNCLGILQGSPGESASAVHLAFVEKLLGALRAVGRPVLLVHLSIPGAETNDHTRFAQSKRDAERAIAESGLPFVILRPGFVFAPAACGGCGRRYFRNCRPPGAELAAGRTRSDDLLGLDASGPNQPRRNGGKVA